METDNIKGTLITAVFEDHDRAERAILDLRERGVGDDALSIIGRHHETDSIITGEPGDDDVVENSHVARGAIGGGALGAGLAVAAVAIPGLGAFLAGGVLATALTTGVTVGAGIGGLAEALRDKGVNEGEARFYETRMGDDVVLIGVDAGQTDLPAEEIDRILLANGGLRQATGGTDPAIGMADTAIGATDQRVPAGTTSL